MKFRSGCVGLMFPGVAAAFAACGGAEKGSSSGRAEVEVAEPSASGVVKAKAAQLLSLARTIVDKL